MFLQSQRWWECQIGNAHAAWLKLHHLLHFVYSAMQSFGPLENMQELFLRIGGAEKESTKQRRKHTEKHKKRTTKCRKKTKPEFRKMKKRSKRMQKNSEKKREHQKRRKIKLVRSHLPKMISKGVLKRKMRNLKTYQCFRGIFVCRMKELFVLMVTYRQRNIWLFTWWNEQKRHEHVVEIQYHNRKERKAEVVERRMISSWCDRSKISTAWYWSTDGRANTPWRHGNFGKVEEQGEIPKVCRSCWTHHCASICNWAVYRIGMNQTDLNAMVIHNKNQVDQQKNRKAWLGGSANIVERVIIQNDPSYTTMCKLIKLVSGCESFSMLSSQRSSGKHLSIDMEALVGEPTNQDADQESVLILNQHGLNNFHGASRDVFKNLREGRAQLLRQLIDNEDYSINIPHLKYAPPAASDVPSQNPFGSDTRPRNTPRSNQALSSGEPIVYAPGGQSYDPPKRDRAEEPQDDPQPESSQVGASAKAHAAKTRPASPEAKSMPEPQRRQPPDPPPSQRMQEERRENTTYAEGPNSTNEPGQSSQQSTLVRVRKPVVKGKDHIVAKLKSISISGGSQIWGGFQQTFFGKKSFKSEKKW